MNLEDHVGDVIRKARLMKGVAPAAAAQAAGLSEDEFATLESSGHSARRPNYAALGALLELDAAKLEALAAGWHPDPKDLSRWRELRVFTTHAEGISVNAYLVWDEVTREAAIFDTGWDAAPLLRAIEENGLHLRFVCLTHTHHDHVAGLEAIRRAHPKVRVRTNSRHAPLDQRNKPDEILPLGGLRITHRDTPGHAEDGVTYIVGNWQEDAPHVAFVGDAIFAGSMGGAPQHGALARQKIREQILSLPPETLLCPGHGPMTTVAEERAHNPFF